MLNGTGDAQRNVDAGMHGLAGLADLMVSAQPALVGDGTGSTDNAAQSPEDRCRLADIQQAEDLLNTLLTKRQCFSLKDLTVKGGDLMALGLRGREVGDALQYLLNAVLDGTPNDKETLLKLAAERK